MTYAERVVAWLRERLDRDPPLAQPQELNMALRVLALWRDWKLPVWRHDDEAAGDPR